MATGTLSQAYYDESDPTALKTDSLDFTATISGGDVTLAFGSGATSWQGKLSGDTLLLSYALADGTLTTLTFSPGSVDDYNTAVAAVQSATDTAAHQKAVAQAQADAAQAVRDDSATVANAISDVLSQADNLSTGNFADTVQSAQTDLSNTKSDLTQLRSDEPLLRCGDSGVVQGDVGTIEGDQGTLEGDGGTLVVSPVGSL